VKSHFTAINVLIVLNILFYLVTYYVPGMQEPMLQNFGLYFVHNEQFRWWQVVTTMFMHGGFIHLFFNMYGVWAFGSPLEEIVGQKRFLLFYFLSGIGASAIHLLFNAYQYNSLFSDLVADGVAAAELHRLLSLEGTKFTSELGQYSQGLTEPLVELYQVFNGGAVGASGAVYGVLVAFAMFFPNAKLALLFFPFPIAAKYFIPILVALDLFSGVTGISLFGGGIAHFAHVGGALIGFLLMWTWRRRIRQQRTGLPPESYDENVDANP
jgi:membrane associated rhomboid family serine protease